MRERIRRVDQIISGFLDAVLADQRLGQALRIADIVETEAALDAEPVFVGRTGAAGDGDQLVVLDLIRELTADAAIGADAVDGAVGEFGADVGHVDQRRRHQRAGRAGLHAFAAGDAGRIAHRVVEVEHDLFKMAAAGHADDVVDLHFAAGADAEIALNAGVEIDRHGRMAAVGRRHRLAFGKAAGGEFLAFGGLPEFGFRIVRDFDRRLVGQQQFGDHLARGLGAVGLGRDLHAGRRLADAACGQDALAFDLDHADAAIAVGAVAGFRRVAKVRQLDVEPSRGAEDRLAFADVDLAAVDEKGFRGRRFAFAVDFIDRRGVRDGGLALPERLPTGSAFFVVAVTGRRFAICHGSPSAHRFFQIVGKEFQHRQKWVRRRLAEAADRSIAHQRR